MGKTCCGRVSNISQNVFAEVFAVLNKRGQGFVSVCTHLNVFSFFTLAFVLQCGENKLGISYLNLSGPFSMWFICAFLNKNREPQLKVEFISVGILDRD